MFCMFLFIFLKIVDSSETFQGIIYLLKMLDTFYSHPGLSSYWASATEYWCDRWGFFPLCMFEYLYITLKSSLTLTGSLCLLLQVVSVSFSRYLNATHVVFEMFILITMEYLLSVVQKILDVCLFTSCVWLYLSVLAAWANIPGSLPSAVSPHLPSLMEETQTAAQRRKCRQTASGLCSRSCVDAVPRTTSR